MQRTTIDQLDIKNHVRWAEDQALLDIHLISESSEVRDQSAIFGTSLIYTSKLEEIINLGICYRPWAAFVPPNVHPLRLRSLFSYHLFPTIHWEDEASEEEPDEANSKRFQRDLIKRILSWENRKPRQTAVFEKEKTAILSLLEAVKLLDQLLGQIKGRTLQYQKG